MRKSDYLKVKKDELSVIKGGRFYEDCDTKEERITIEYLRGLFNVKGKSNYTDEQLIAMQKFLFQMAEIAIECYKRNKKLKPLFHYNENDTEKKSNSVPEGEHRRTG